jgi:site-specific DNA recombinase
MTDVSTGKTADIYLRISSDREGRELGVRRQEEDCRELAARLGFTVDEVFCDNDISASRRSTKPRPDYKRLLAKARAGRTSAVIAATSGRLTRQPRELEDWIDLAESGLIVAFVTSGKVELTTSSGQTVARIYAAIDAGEAEQISERARREREQRRVQGRWHGGNRPFGFERDGTTPRLAEQELIRTACSELLAGQTLASIARDWTRKTDGPPNGKRCGRANEVGEVCRRKPGQGTDHFGDGACGRHEGKERIADDITAWRPGSVRDVLINPRIAGMLPDKRPARWDAVISEETWHAVCTVLNDPARRKEKRRTRLLTGIALCGVEGCPGHVYGGMDQYHRPTYRCSAARHLDRLVDPVDDFVVRAALKWLGNRGDVHPGPPQSPAGDLGAEKKLLQARLQEAGDRYASGAWPTETVDRITAAISAKIADIERRMASAAATSVLADLPMGEAELHQAWAEWDVDRRRAVLKATQVKVRIRPPGRGVKAFNPETVVITWPDGS